MYVVGFIIQILNSKMTTMGVGTSLRGGGKGASQLFQRMKIKPLPLVNPFPPLRIVGH